MTISFLLSGTPEDYGEAVKSAIKMVLATAADVSTSAVRLTLTAGSVLVNADIFFARREEGPHTPLFVERNEQAASILLSESEAC